MGNYTILTSFSKITTVKVIINAWGNLLLLSGNHKTNDVNTPMHMVKNTLNSYGKSGICIFNTQTYCLTMENVHLTASVNNHFLQ